MRLWGVELSVWDSLLVKEGTGWGELGGGAFGPTLGKVLIIF